MLTLARVVEIHPESHAVDLVVMDDGRRLAGVQVLSGSAGSNFGLSDLAAPDAVGYEAAGTGERDTLAVVSWVRDIPVVLGFLFPQVAQCLFADRERMVYRHASDVYTTIDGSGNTEVYHPSGTFLRIGASPGHEDLTGKDYDKVWAIKRNTGAAVHVHLEVANAGASVASLNIDPSGNVSLTHSGNLTTSTGGNLSATVGGSASVNSSGAMTLTAPTITLNGSVVLNGPLTQGMGGGGGGATLLGPITVTNDVTAGGISLKNHVHPGVQAGGSSTGKPA